MRKLLVITALLLFAGVAFGQSIQKGGVLAVHHLTITLNPDVTMNQYLDFMNNTLIPEFEKQFQGVKVFMLKGLNREIINEYGIVFHSESLEVFNKYWNNDGSNTDKGEAAMVKIQSTLDDMNKLVTTTSNITDWVIQ